MRLHEKDKDQTRILIAKSDRIKITKTSSIVHKNQNSVMSTVLKSLINNRHKEVI